MREINIISLLCIILLASNCLKESYGQLDPEKLALIENVVNNVFIPRNYVTGMSLSIVQNGEILLSNGYGKMDIEKGMNATNKTLFAIASVSKSFIGTLAVKVLSERFAHLGESVLDTPILNLNPNFNFTFSDRYRSEQTTFRDLLSHKTCLNTVGTELLFGTLSTAREFNYRTRYESQACGHRAGFIYNNALYALVGEMIASIAGTSIQSLVRNFMIEIGMEDATTIDTEGTYENLPNMSQGYYRKDGQIQKFNRGLLRRIHVGLGAGGILATSTDMAKYMNFHLKKGKVGDRQIISEEAMSWIYKPSSIFVNLYPREFANDSVTGTYAYGLGLVLSLFDGYQSISHDGYWPSFNSYLNLFPAKNIGVFLVTNGPGMINSEINHAFIAATIFDILTGSLPNGEHVTSRIGNANKNHFKYFDKANTANQYIPTNFDMGVTRMNLKIGDNILELRNEDFMGIYGERQAGDLTVTLDDQDSSYIQMNLGEWGIGRLHPINGSQTMFEIDWKTDFLHLFYTNPPETPIPTVQLDFWSNGRGLDLLLNYQVFIQFVKNATIDTFPVIPWNPSSCGPQAS